MSGDDEGTPLLVGAEAVVFVETVEDIKRNYCLIGTVGVWNVLFGVACLMYPVLASHAVEFALSITVFVSGIFHLVSVLCGDRGPRRHFFVLGIVQVILGCVMYAHPFETLYLLTIFIAFMYMSFGSYEIGMAQANTNTAARGLTILSGFMSIFISVFILVWLPISSLLAVGVLLGVNHLNVGISRIVVSCYGRSLSRNAELAATEENVTFMPAWMV